jgi:HlyD family secretion protein
MRLPDFNRTATRPVLFLLLLLLTVGVGCSSTAEGEEPADGEKSAEGGDSKSKAKADGDDAEPAEEKKKPKKAKERITSIVASEVVRGDLVLPVIAEGSIRARNEAEIKFEIAGRLIEIHVIEGQRVRKGDTLATIDDRDYQLSLEEANSRYLQALGQLAVEEDGYSGEGTERTLTERVSELKRLEQEGLITREERLDRELDLGMEAVRDGAYRRELLEVRSGLATARRDIARLELDLERTLILAPFDGVITELFVDEGERAQIGDTLCRLVDDVNIEARVGVLESDLGAVKEPGHRLREPNL